MGDNAAIARRFFREVWREGGAATVQALLARDIVGWVEGCDVNSSEDFKQARRQLLEVFPDMPVTVEDVVEQDDDSRNLGGLISSLTSAGARREDPA